MNKSFWKSNLGIKILCYVFISAAIAAVSIIVLPVAFDKTIYLVLDNTSIPEENVKLSVENLQKFIDDNNIATTDSQALFSQLLKDKNNMFYIFTDGKYVNSSDDPNSGYLVEKTNHFRYVVNNQKLLFSDAEATATIINIYSEQFYTTSKIVSYIMSVFIFVIVLLNLIKKRFSYINELKKEIEILEGGNLDYEIAVKGNDEIADLAVSLESMRKAFKEIIEDKSIENKANKMLVASLTHDLRTPLTTQIGYLDMLDDGKITDDKQMSNYIHKIREKAYQIKSLSDNLFSYSVKNSTEKINIEKVNFITLYEQIINEYIFMLKEKNYKINVNIEKCPYFILIDTNLFIRVLDNIFQNIIKYADKENVIIIDITKFENNIKMQFSNHKDKTWKLTESSKIGLKNVKNIISTFNGTINIFDSDEIFSIQIVIPYEN